MSDTEKAPEKAEKKAPQWKPGQSGNPNGRKPGTGAIQKLREKIGEFVPEILSTLLAKALEGDVGAAKLLLERVVPPLKPVEQAQPIDFPVDADLTTQGHAVMRAAAAGVISASQAASYMTALGSLARVVEVDDLLKRIEALETQTRPA
jgi:hypothetical protein